MSRLRTKTYKIRRVRSDFYLLANILKRKQFIGVCNTDAVVGVSLFKTAKPSSLGLDHSGRGFRRDRDRDRWIDRDR